jgi:hypothetical protein
LVRKALKVSQVPLVLRVRKVKWVQSVRKALKATRVILGLKVLLVKILP